MWWRDYVIFDDVILVVKYVFGYWVVLLNNMNVSVMYWKGIVEDIVVWVDVFVWFLYVNRFVYLSFLYEFGIVNWWLVEK